MPEWLMITGAISAVAVAAGIVSGPSLSAKPIGTTVPSTPVTLDFKPPSVPVAPSPVQSPSAVPVDPPALTTEPVRPTVRTVPPRILDTLAPTTDPTTVPPVTVPPTTTTENPCDIGLVLDPILRVCVSI